MGDAIDLAGFTEQLEAIGYFSDDRVDEPGELALRGQVIDVFPADSGAPYRLEAQDGKLAAIRAYDPATQLTNGECDQLALGRASEPQLGEGVTLLDHLPRAALAVEPGAERRRLQYLRLAADAANRRPERAMRDICIDARWRSALEDHDEIALEDGFGDPPPRFVETKAPARAFAKIARESLADGDRLVLLGSERDLRFVSARVDEDAEDRDDRRGELGRKQWRAIPGPWSRCRWLCPRGFRLPGVLAVACADLLGSRAQRDDAPVSFGDISLMAMGEIRIGDAVIHEDHGLAVVAGLEAASRRRRRRHRASLCRRHPAARAAWRGRSHVALRRR